MNDLSSYLAMGGHAAFIWPALGVAAFVLIAMALASVIRLRRSEAELRAAEVIGGGRRRRSAAAADLHMQEKPS